ncbi:ribonuclease R [Mycoplasmoides pirum]|uniref:ribonuclease R n=1 Tax=Mycoplasmoides pirum TaxID=2122 RepID=UPI000486FC73|nr:ribonuclease R [Mycoplasmoides pirum]
MNLEPIEQQILEIIKKENGRPVPPGIMVRLLEENYGTKGKQKIYQTIDKLIASGLLRQLSKNNKLVLGYENAPILFDQAQEGTISIGSKNCGFIRLDNDERATYFVHSLNLKGALNGDRVKFAPLDKNELRDLKDAAVIEVISRNKKRYVGKYTFDGNKYFVYPDDSKMYLTVTLDKEYKELKENDKILFELKEISSETNKATATLVKKIGGEKDLGIDIKSIVYDLNIEYDFSPNAIVESENLSLDINHPRNKIRKDLTDLDIITIDPATSKDLDDAIYVKKLENKNFKLIVAIADVSHYVEFNSELDKDAFSRSTSVYFINQVIPMLPEKLSNDLCSLNPNENKMALISEVEINPQGQVVDNLTYPAIINSKRRFSYDEVNDFFDNKNDLKNDSNSIKLMLKDAKELAQILRKEKRERGFIEFEMPEPIIVVDEMYDPIDVLTKQHGEAQMMIEDFMVCANESITQIANKNKIPFIYRVHPKPSQRKLKIFAQEAKHLEFKISENFLDIKSNTISGWLNNNKNNPNLPIVNILLLRMMAKAFYSTDNTYHFGLGSQHYTHFTSPIRRYADLIVHRLLWMFLYDRENYTEPQRQALKNKLREICDLINLNETRAVTCERTINSHMFCLYMSKKIGEVYEGFVSFVTNYGMFVELENTINGLVRVINMTDDFYTYNENDSALIGREKGRKFTIGDKVKVKVVQIDLHARQIHFSLV